MLNISSARTSLFYSIHTFLSSNSLPLTCRTSKRSLFPVNVHTLPDTEAELPVPYFGWLRRYEAFLFQKSFPISSFTKPQLQCNSSPYIPTSKLDLLLRWLDRLLGKKFWGRIHFKRSFLKNLLCKSFSEPRLPVSSTTTGFDTFDTSHTALSKSTILSVHSNRSFHLVTKVSATSIRKDLQGIFVQPHPRLRTGNQVRNISILSTALSVIVDSLELKLYSYMLFDDDFSISSSSA
jgi:hypothetical protein